MDDLRLVVDRAKGRPAVVVYTIVEPELREAMSDFCRRAKLHYCDILGPPLASIAKISGRAAKMAPGVRHPLDSAYFRRIGAIEFAVKYDDGMGGGLREADIVLVGVSRTRRRRSRCTSASWATRPRTSRSCGGSSRRRTCSRSTRPRSSG